MSMFSYRAYSAEGDLVEGEIEARSREEAEEQLWGRGVTPFTVQEKRAATNFSLGGLFSKSGPSAAEIASFTREFATLEEADLPLDNSLRILAQQSASPAVRALAEEILRRVVDGASLSDALNARAELFGADYLNIIRAGETMGNVAQSLIDIADMLERRLEMRAKIQSGLVYPALLIVLAIGSTGVVIGTLVPSIAPIFADNGKPMPKGLQFIIDLQGAWPLILGGVVALGAGLYGLKRYAAANPPLQIKLDRALLDLPYAGDIIAKFQAARFARTLGAMSRAGVPLLQGLESARAVVSNAHFRAELAGAIESVRSGGALSSALEQIDAFPLAAAQMTRIGEEVAKLDELLLRLATMFERQTQRGIERAVGLITPILTILIAAVVGGLVMTVMDAVLGINELAGQ
ncbi:MULTISPECIES: type II secretion system F family protein [Methylosinus]|uniref:Type II secretion system F family protein n=1 Tax=Methylosinus trichosporium (strain ATCC 35070 / NCIMB 11131 / UNIQEM 75 / OB3b) TaxID=595536 RepID=A0A2D2CUM8_METT3|nr:MULTISPECIES: type II secretion system F family protein [Methylosinus]ATQ66521.1 type II secretion system F family protein [Methylosinus trichosporium OB3b]OBS52638.1 type II secretion protein F [Methylosinus sp. 3S-1]